MKESEVNSKLEQHDKDLRQYIDMKMRAVKKMLSVFIWMQKHPWKTLLMLFIFVGLCFFAYRVIDLKTTIENKTGIELKE